MKPTPAKKHQAHADIHPYLSLIERVARAEHRRIPQHMIELEEMMSVAALSLQALLNNKTAEQIKNLNISYIATATRWAIRNELRTRTRWYAQKYEKQPNEAAPQEPQQDENGVTLVGVAYPAAEDQVRDAVYQTILSIDAMQTNDDGEAQYDTIADKRKTPEQELEESELGRAIKQAIEKLPPRERAIVQARFFQNKQVKEIASELNLSSSRVTRIVQSSMEQIRASLKKQSFIESGV
jgi:RNA polymerase sigma factor (sigma-70 family)